MSPMPLHTLVRLISYVDEGWTCTCVHAHSRLLPTDISPGRGNRQLATSCRLQGVMRHAKEGCGHLNHGSSLQGMPCLQDDSKSMATHWQRSWHPLPQSFEVLSTCVLYAGRRSRQAQQHPLVSHSRSGVPQWLAVLAWLCVVLPRSIHRRQGSCLQQKSRAAHLQYVDKWGEPAHNSVW